MSAIITPAKTVFAREHGRARKRIGHAVVRRTEIGGGNVGESDQADIITKDEKPGLCLEAPINALNPYHFDIAAAEVNAPR